MDFTDELARRYYYADQLEALFRSRPLEWVSLVELMTIGGPSWRSRIACDLRKKRKLRVEWNEDCRRSAYRFVPYVPLGPSADRYRETSGRP